MALRFGVRDTAILRHLARYRLSTMEILHREFFEPEGRDVEAAKSTLRRFWQTVPLVASKPLYGQGREVYYHLTPDGARELGVPSPDAVAHGFDALEVRATHYGRLLFCCARDTPRPLFTAGEFDACFPGLRPRGSPLAARFGHDAYYIDIAPDGTRRLGRILVDLRGDVLADARRAVEVAAETLPEFLRTGHFALALVLPSPQKLTHAKFTLHSAPLATDVPVHVVLDCQPELARVLATSL